MIRQETCVALAVVFRSVEIILFCLSCIRCVDELHLEKDCVTTRPVGTTRPVDSRLTLQDIDLNPSHVNLQLMTVCPVGELLKGDVLGSKNANHTNNLYEESQ